MYNVKGYYKKNKRKSNYKCAWFHHFLYLYYFLYTLSGSMTIDWPLFSSYIMSLCLNCFASFFTIASFTRLVVFCFYYYYYSLYSFIYFRFLVGFVFFLSKVNFLLLCSIKSFRLYNIVFFSVIDSFLMGCKNVCVFYVCLLDGNSGEFSIFNCWNQSRSNIFSGLVQFLKNCLLIDDMALHFYEQHSYVFYSILSNSLFTRNLHTDVKI